MTYEEKLKAAIAATDKAVRQVETATGPATEAAYRHFFRLALENERKVRGAQ